MSPEILLKLRSSVVQMAARHPFVRIPASLRRHRRLGRIEDTINVRHLTGRSTAGLLTERRNPILSERWSLHTARTIDGRMSESGIDERGRRSEPWSARTDEGEAGQVARTE
jgi:hypothetical protein